jgi:poly-gamma-glutamate synthesis protein (capsule biosynthesis protein)
LVGDVMLGRGVNEVLRERAPSYPWGDTLAVLAGADFRFANLECVISDRGVPWPDKEFCFRADAKNVEVLRAAAIGGVSLANNHTLDYGCDALADTVALLDAAGIGHSGAGANAAQALAPMFADAGGARIAVVSFTDNEPSWEAGPERGGIAYVPIDLDDHRAARLFDTIKRAKREADLVIASAHWGPNWGYEPPRAHVPFAHRMVEIGADVVFGHSGHVFRGIEVYRGRPIIYCAGDFIDDYAVDPDERNDESFIFVVECDDGSLGRCRLYPTVIEECQARLAEAGRAVKITSKMERLCARLGTAVRWDARQGRSEIEIF